MTSVANDLARVEAVWAGPVGTEYVARNRHHQQARGAFWTDLAVQLQPRRVLEVGCCIGTNLACLVPYAETLIGVDVNAAALAEVPFTTYGRATSVLASASRLPFPDGAFDLVFTAGLLIHIPDDALDGVFDELVRVSSRWVVTVEYEDTHRRGIPWRGQTNVLWADSFGLKLWRRHPALVPVARRPVGQEAGFDRCGLAVFSKRVEDALRDT